MPTSRADEPRRIAVLLATHNGLRWIGEQVTSILDQGDVLVRIIAMDDGSTDGTAQWLADRASDEPRITVLPDGDGGGSAAANFYRLITTAEISDDELVAFSDQDDVWMPGKLARHARLIEAGHDGVSSNVTSFTPDGKRSLVRKAYPQREYDYLLESPGPGSTFLMTPRLVALAAEVITTGQAATMDYHDSLVYAVARARGWRWHIEDVSTVDYRQHDNNVIGSNVGVRSALARLRLIRQHWHRRHATTLARIGVGVADAQTRQKLEELLALLEDYGPRARRALAARAHQLRRRKRDQRIIAVLITVGVW